LGARFKTLPLIFTDHTDQEFLPRTRARVRDDHGEMASTMYLVGVTSAAKAAGFASWNRRAPPQQAKIGLAGGP
jgi:hypothetical protein